MKKLKVTIAALCLSIGIVSAQSSTTAPAKKATSKTSSTKIVTPKGQPSGTTAKAATGTTTPAKHLKKDGTPDMRYKENKAAKKAATPAATQPATGK